MGDRCYMEIWCRESDTKPFEDLGFTVQEHGAENSPGIVRMVDEEANYAHCGELPTINVPWTGRSEPGGGYGASEYACDGETFLELAVGQDGGYVVSWDSTMNAPSALDVADIQQFKALEAKVTAMFKPEPQVQ